MREDDLSFATVHLVIGPSSFRDKSNLWLFGGTRRHWFCQISRRVFIGNNLDRVNTSRSLIEIEILLRLGDNLFCCNGSNMHGKNARILLIGRIYALSAVKVGVMRGRRKHFSVKVLVVEQQGRLFDRERLLLIYESVAVEMWSDWFSLLLLVNHNSLIVQWPIEKHPSSIVGMIVRLDVRL